MTGQILRMKHTRNQQVPGSVRAAQGTGQEMANTMHERPTRWLRPVALVTLALLLAACASSPNRAPVEDRKPVPRSAPPAPAPVTPADGTRSGPDSAAKPGFYTVKPGDMLIRIALEHGQNWRDVQRWNGLENPNVIEVGQVLRVAPPPPDANPVATARPVQPAGRVDSKPSDTRAAASAPAAASAAAGSGSAAIATPPVVASAPAAPVAPVAPLVTAPASTPAPAPARPPREGDDDINWLWPATGPVAAGFDEARSKGLAITGRAGDPVLAAADGRVVYAGSGLRGYGNLVIVKHNATYLTAYAHNQTLLVKDEQVVRRGQKIAEMGSSDAERVQLHFEIRRQGVPIDPLKLLPTR